MFRRAWAGEMTSGLVCRCAPPFSLHRHVAPPIIRASTGDSKPRMTGVSKMVGNISAMGICCLLIVSAEDEKLGVAVERNVPVKMRDGVILRADVHRPDRGGQYPVLVSRMPYGKSGNLDRYVKAGYIVVCQDVRGRYEPRRTSTRNP